METLILGIFGMVSPLSIRLVMPLVFLSLILGTCSGDRFEKLSLKLFGVPINQFVSRRPPECAGVFCGPGVMCCAFLLVPSPVRLWDFKNPIEPDYPPFAEECLRRTAGLGLQPGRTQPLANGAEFLKAKYMSQSWDTLQTIAEENALDYDFQVRNVNYPVRPVFANPGFAVYGEVVSHFTHQSIVGVRKRVPKVAKAGRNMAQFRAALVGVADCRECS